MPYNYEKLLVPQIEDQLVMYIQHENIGIGAKLPSEYKLAEIFGVGRSTIREAVKSLVTKGMLEVKRGSGTFVKSTEIVVDDLLGLAQFEDKYRLAMELFEVRMLLEPDVAAVACQKATEEDKKRIKSLCDEVEQLYLSGQNHIKKDMEFHETIARCSGSSVKDIDTNTSFNDELTVNMGGTDEKVKITADIRVPECDTMSVTEVERIPCTKEFKEKVIKAYFGDSQVYYYDYAHMTKKELEEIIETLDRDNNSLSDDASEEILKWHDDMKTECTKALETAADVWTEATEYDSCDDFVGKIGDTWFHLQFSRPDDDNSVLSGIQSYPLDRCVKSVSDGDPDERSTKFDDGYVKQYYGPKSLKEYDTVRYLNGDFIDGDLPVSDVNEANISFDEAKKKAGDFMQAIGIESMIKTGESDCEWEGYNKTEDNVYKEGDVHRAIWGYALEYSLGADDVVYSKSLNVFDYSAYNKFCPMDCPGYETGSFNVNEYGVYRFDIAEPVSIVKKQQKVELLPVSNIYKIARNELESHPDKYIVEADTQYRYLTLGYIRVKDSSDSQRFSYIPAWSLELLQRGEVESCPVFVNAIDGTVIEPEQIF